MAAAAATIAAVNAAKARQGGGRKDRADSAEDVAQKAEDAAKEKERLARRGPLLIAWESFVEFVNRPGVQCLLYFAFVFIFQNLTSCMRIRTEFYIDKHVMDRLIENHFDSSHNTFESIRRVADIYEWGNNVLWPGLMGDLGPCDGDNVGSVRAHFQKACLDEVWPDGDGSFHGGDRLVAGDGPTPYSVEQLVERMDQFDWTEGLLIRQGRAAASECAGTHQLGECYPELTPGTGSREPYGFNWTHPTEPPAHPFTYLSTSELGSSTEGIQSASTSTAYFGRYDADGFAAVVIPFFSDTFLPYEEGNASSVTDYRLSSVTPSNGRTPRYYCIRTSINAHHVEQQCDPGTLGNGTGALTGVVRRQAEVMWNNLKRGHYIDMRTRVMTITLQLKSNHEGIRYRMTMIFEITALGAIFTSYDVETRVLQQSLVDDMALWANIALGMVIFFCLLEAIEIMSVGALEYFSNMWNAMDWANFIIFYMVWFGVQDVYRAIDETPEYGGAQCTSYMCAQVGYWDDWKVMAAYRNTKIYLSLCVCIQLFKLLRFIELMVPKIGLATDVLRKCLVDLVFFGISFIISMLAFSMMLYVQLGPFMASYINNEAAFISIARALFGDFDIDEILDNSKDYLNAILFIGYLFIAIFIMLSMFLAILADAQVAIKEAKEARTDEERIEQDGWPDEYGAITASKRGVSHAAAMCGLIRPAEAAAEKKEEDPEPPTLDDVMQTVQELLATQQTLMDEVKALRAGRAADSEGAELAPSTLLAEVQAMRQEVTTLKDKSVVVNFAPPTIAAAYGAPQPSSPPVYRPQPQPSSRAPQPPPPPPPPPPGPPPGRVLAANGAQAARYNV